MQQVKIFKGLEGETGQLEKQINAWLGQAGVRVLQISGNIAPQSPAIEPKVGNLSGTAFTPSDIIVIVLYEKA